MNGNLLRAGMSVMIALSLVACTSVEERQQKAKDVLDETVGTASGVTKSVTDYLEAVLYFSKTLIGSVQMGITEVQDRAESVKEGVDKLNEGRELLQKGLYGDSGTGAAID